MQILSSAKHSINEMLYLYLQLLVLIIMSLILVILPNDKLLCKYEYKFNIMESFCTCSVFKKWCQQATFLLVKNSRDFFSGEAIGWE